MTGIPEIRYFAINCVGIANRLIGRDRDRVENHPALGFLHPVHFCRLIHRRQHPMNNPDTALAGDGDGQRDSVTVSMAELIMGILILMWRVSLVRMSTSLGKDRDLAGTNTTSS